MVGTMRRKDTGTLRSLLCSAPSARLRGFDNFLTESPGTVPRPPDGTVSADRSRVAILAAVAARAALLPDGKRVKFAIDHGLNVGSGGISRALALRLRPARKSALPDPDQREWLWHSFEVDARKLELDQIMAWIPRPSTPGRRSDQGRLLAALQATPGVVSIHDCFDDTILVEAIVANPLQKRRLQTRLEELAPEVIWSEVREVVRDQAAKGWLEVAQEVAKAEERLDLTADVG
jgi:hypothetical protein